jgi:hypothetical protein
MELGQDLPGVELEKTCLIRPNLVDPDVRIARLGGLRDCHNVTRGIWTVDDCVCQCERHRGMDTFSY